MIKQSIILTTITISAFVISCAGSNSKKEIEIPVGESNYQRTPSSTGAYESPWTDWSTSKGKVGGLLALKHIRENLLKYNLHDPHVDYRGYGRNVSCNSLTDMYRTADGTCYDPRNPLAGSAGVAFGRNVPPQYIDYNAQKNLMVPDPAKVSQVLFTRDKIKEVGFLNMLAASWIQFMNHDWLTHGKNEESSPYTVDGAKASVKMVERTKDNESDRRQYKNRYSVVTTNEVTHWWDGSQLYGSNQATQNRLRSFHRGHLRMVPKSDGKMMLPKDMDLDPRRNVLNRGYELTGFRDNWWVGLSMLHHLFAMEHNRVANKLFDKYVSPATGHVTNGKKWVWDENKYKKVKDPKKKVRYMTDEELDEHLFQVSRLINAAVMAKIHTIEWTPAILNNPVLRRAMYANWYGLVNPESSPFLSRLITVNKADWFSFIKSGYVVGGIVGDKRNDYGVPYSITEEFTSVYRLHPLIPEALSIQTTKNKFLKRIPLAQTRNEKSYAIMEQYKMDDLFYSFGRQNPGQLVLNNHPKFMQDMEIPGLGKMDLAMVDVLRDRERGVPRYNQFRRALGLKPINTYSDFFPGGQAVTKEQKANLNKLIEVYGRTADGKDNVEMIDLVVGMYAEEVRPEGFGFGETQFQIFILMASRRLMADKFYTNNYNERYYTEFGIDWIDKEGYLDKVILRHMPNLEPKLKDVKTAFNPWNR